MDLNSKINIEKYDQIISNIHLSKDSGKVKEVVGLMIKGYLPGAAVGGVVEIFPNGLERSFLGEIVGFKDKDVLIMPLNEMRGVGLGSKIVLAKQSATVRVGDALIGRVVNGLGLPLDGRPDIEDFEERPLYAEVVNPLHREPITMPLDLGVRAINSCLTVGLGQRVSIMAGSGVGKSVLLGMMARYTNADINVIALIGERGREVREFIENDLGAEGMKKTVVVCVTSDQSPLLRMRGAYVATAIAEYFCDKGQNVLLMMDSITRFSMAQREIGLSSGEPPSSRGYTPSVFAQLPKLLERAGNFENKGSITGLYTTLVEGDDMNDPIGDSVRSIVDGHIVLSRSLAQRGHFPSIDVLASASRVMKNVTKPDQQKLSQKLRENLAIYREAEDLINIGAYKPGANPKIDKAVKLIDSINDFLRQRVEEGTSYSQTLKQLQQLFVGN